MKYSHVLQLSHLLIWISGATGDTTKQHADICNNVPKGEICCGGGPTDTPKCWGCKTIGRGTIPWQVSLQNTESGHFAAGIIVNRNWILTTADSVRHQNMVDIHVAVGFHNVDNATSRNLGDEEADLGMAIRTVSEIKFSNEITDDEHGVALLKLKSSINYAEPPRLGSPLNFDSYTRPACFHNYQIYQLETQLDSCKISGWGKTEDDEQPNVLKSGNLTLVRRPECKKKYNNMLEDHIICAEHAKEKYIDACEGDAGGPLTCNQKTYMTLRNRPKQREPEERDIVAALISPGGDCAAAANNKKKRKPGLYISIGKYLDWMTETCKEVQVIEQLTKPICPKGIDYRTEKCGQTTTTPPPGTGTAPTKAIETARSESLLHKVIKFVKKLLGFE